MADFTPEIAAELIAACTEGASETAEALSRAFDAAIAVEVGEASTVDRENLPDEFDGPGLVFVLNVGEVAALVVLPESSGMLPDWYANPDPTGESKLATLAQELGMLVLPEEFMPEDFKASRVDNLAAAIVRAEIATGAGLATLALSADDKKATLTVIWPAAKPQDALSPPAVAEDRTSAETPPEVAATEPAPAVETPPVAAQAPPESQPVPEFDAHQFGRNRKRSNAKTFEEGLKELSDYTHSLLRITVPVSVTLAETKQTVDEVIRLGPGSIIQFEKSCDEMLGLEVGGRLVAEGEAVKIGDKFGLRITSMVLPEERFAKVEGLRHA